MSELFFPQQREMTCAVAALRSVLATQFDVRIREDVLRFAGDDVAEPIVRLGTDTTQLRRMLAAANRAVNTGPRWRLRVWRHGTIADVAREIRAGRYPLASVRRGALGATTPLHMIVLCGYRPGRVRYFDPYDGKTRWVGAGLFRREWRDEEGVTWLAAVTGGIGG